MANLKTNVDTLNNDKLKNVPALLINLKSKVDKLDVDKLVPVPVDFTTRKTIFSFSRRPEKMVFPKKSRWNMVFLLLLGKMISLFPENMILPLKQKMEDDHSQKNARKYDISSNVLKRWSFQKGPRRDMIFLVLSGKMLCFFSPKT